MKIYSHSKLATYEQCALKYKLRYIDKIKPEVEDTIERFLGTCVHAALEFLYNQLMEGELADLDRLITEYISIWHKDFSAQFVINDNNLTAQDYFNRGVRFLTQYYVRNSPFKEQTLGTERKIFLQLTADHGLIGFVDRLAYNPLEEAYEIHDYKTGSMKTKSQLMVDRQLALYSLALQEEFKDGKNILLVWHYLDHDEKIVLRKTQGELEKLRKEVLQLIDEIEQANNFPHNKGHLCNWCEFKPICPAWVKQSNLGEF